ncbi:MAG: type II secretion system protein [Bacteroidales bacterium]|nr:type II secretion system protein [Bacteroidales bacterium]
MKKIKLYRLKAPGFSLTELLVVLIIIGILVLVALPNLLPLITKAKTVEAKQHLSHIYTLEKSFFYMHSKYSDELEAIDYIAEKTVKSGGSANYVIEIVHASYDGFLARATSVVDFDQDGVLNVWEIDQDKKLIEVVKD